MRKLKIIFIGLMILVLGGAFTYLKMNPPLDTGALGYTTDKKIVLVEVGNVGVFKDIFIDEVFINDAENPSKIMVQVSNPLEGFVITDEFNKGDEFGVSFENIDSIRIQPSTGIQEQLDKVNNQTATKDDKSYAITISHNETIQTVKIKYRYFWIPYEQEVYLN